jgi:hypothetical protein
MKSDIDYLFQSRLFAFKEIRETGEFGLRGNPTGRGKKAVALEFNGVNPCPQA